MCMHMCVCVYSVCLWVCVVCLCAVCVCVCVCMCLCVCVSVCLCVPPLVRLMQTVEKTMCLVRRRYDAKIPDQLPQLMKDTVRAAVSCKFRSMYIQPLLLPMTYEKSKSCTPFGDCLAKNQGMLGLVTCLPVLSRHCFSANVSVAKTVRLSMKMAGSLLQKDPKVKVIHLVRDPRGVLHSREITQLTQMYNLTPSQFCSVVQQDLKVGVFVMREREVGCRGWGEGCWGCWG